jgi:hypothetical protein
MYFLKKYNNGENGKNKKWREDPNSVYGACLTAHHELLKLIYAILYFYKMKERVEKRMRWNMTFFVLLPQHSTNSIQ